MKNIYNYVLNLLFPKKCIHCHREGAYLCEDCLSLIELNQITYCACFKNPCRNKIRCGKCPKSISAVYTILNEKQAICKKLFLKSKIMPELNLYFSYMIIAFMKNRTSLEIDQSFAIYFEDKEVENLAKNLSQYIRIPIKNKAENVLFLTKKYPCVLENVKAKNIYVISLFR
ncbi:MAG: hypothetical protein WC157_02120 [Candidatus Paceibacterota bacterium]